MPVRRDFFVQRVVTLLDAVNDVLIRDVQYLDERTHRGLTLDDFHVEVHFVDLHLTASSSVNSSVAEVAATPR